MMHALLLATRGFSLGGAMMLASAAACFVIFVACWSTGDRWLDRAKQYAILGALMLALAGVCGGLYCWNVV